jgi:hypothetical protein
MSRIQFGWLTVGGLAVALTFVAATDVRADIKTIQAVIQMYAHIPMAPPENHAHPATNSKSLAPVNKPAKVTMQEQHEPNREKPADVYLHNPRGGNVADNRVESKITDWSKLGKQARQKLLEKPRSLGEVKGEPKVADGKKTESEASGTQASRTPPVVVRRPVSTAGLGQHGIQESPDQRLANPKFVPQASNRGRSEPAQKSSASPRH